MDVPHIALYVDKEYKSKDLGPMMGTVQKRVNGMPQRILKFSFLFSKLLTQNSAGQTQITGLSQVVVLREASQTPCTEITESTKTRQN